MMGQELAKNSLLIFHKPTALTLGNRGRNILAGGAPWGKNGGGKFCRLN